MGKLKDIKNLKKGLSGLKGKLHKAAKATLKVKVITGVACAALLIVIAICVAMSIQNRFDTILQSTLGWLSVIDDEDKTKEVDLYDVDTNIGVVDCKLRPQTGVYPGSSGSDGLGTSRGEFPSGYPTIDELIHGVDKANVEADISSGRYSRSTAENRGKTKSTMGWQTLANTSHASHSNPNAIIDYKSLYAPQHQFVLAIKEGCRDFTGVKATKMKKGEITWFDDDGFGKVDGRYTIAIKEDLGKYVWGQKTMIGDYVDVYLDGGLVINCIVADIKGHENKSNIIHSDGSIVEFVTSVFKTYGCCNGKGVLVAPSTLKPELNVPVTGIIKVGTYWTVGPDGKPTGRDENGNTASTGAGNADTNSTGDSNTEVYLDSNGNPCTPDDATTGETEGGWTENFGANPGRRTVKNFLQHACSAMGRVAYMWGGGQGNPPNHVIGFDKLLPKYKEYHDADRENKTTEVSNAGLDCCGYVKWAVYQAFHTEEGKSDTDGNTALYYPNSLESKGFGRVLAKSTPWASYDLHPGDIVSKGVSESHAHIWIVIGKTSDGGAVMIHSSGTGELVRLAGTTSEAKALAKKYNDIVNTVSTEVMGGDPVDWFPEGSGQGSGHFTRGKEGYNNVSVNVHIFRWNYDTSGLEDPDGITNMSAEEVLESIIGDGRGTKKWNGAGGKKIFIDPGHGPNNQSDSAKMTSDGYVKNGSAWGEWRHYNSTGAAGTQCNNCGKDSEHQCWYPFVNAIRDKEPTITYGIATKLKTKLEQAGYEVMISRDTASHPAITKRAKMAADWGADIQICIHTNAGGGSGVAYCSPEGGDKGTNKYKGSDWKSKSTDLNKKIYTGIMGAGTGLCSYNSGVIPDYGYLILYEKASCPTAYLEIGFHDKATDYAILSSSEGQDKIANGILAGINSYYGK